MLRRAHRNEVTQQEIESILEGFNTPEPTDIEVNEPVTIKWFSVTRQQIKMGCRGRWAIYYGHEEVGQLEICPDCLTVYPVMAGNIYDGYECCESALAIAA
jgi:hypothetical protein